MDNYSLLIKKLDEFIRKFYKNQLLKGVLLFVGIFLVFYLAVTLLEYFGHFSIRVRTILFYSYLALNLLVFIRLIFMPLLKLLRIGRVITHAEAARIIGAHFPDVKDKLLNTLQLKGLENQAGAASPDLIRASIDQKIDDLKPVPFKSAVDLKKNRRYLKYVLPPLVILLLLITITPRVVTEPTERLVRHSVYYEPVIPFKIEVENEELKAIQQEDFKLNVSVTGDELPADVFIEFGDYSYRLNRKTPSSFDYTFRNLQEDISFVLSSGRYSSPVYELKVMPKPIILSFETLLDYPEYTAIEDEAMENSGDLVVPEGTRVTWKFYTRDTRVVNFRLNDEPKEIEETGSNTFQFGSRILRNTFYSVVTSNQFMTNSDSLAYSISVIPDTYPTITVEQFQDSLHDKRLYFRGLIKDDYGFSRLTYNYIVTDEDRSAADPETSVNTLAFERNSIQQPFFHFFHLDSAGIMPGDEISYYFEVWDNDRVNGPKKSRSQMMTYRAPTIEELENENAESREQIADDMEKAMDDLQELQKEIDELNKKILQKESLSWQDRQQIKDLLEKQQQIEENLKNIELQNEQKSLREKQYKEIDEELVRKQEQLEKLFEELMTDEMKELFEELQKLMEEVDKDKINEMLEDMKMSNEELEKQLDRNLELFKQLEFEKMLQDAIDKLEQLAEKQEQLSEETSREEKNNEELLKEQEKLNEEFEKWREDMDEMHKKNEEMERPNELEKTDEQEEQISDDQQESSESLEKGKNKKAAGSQQDASGKMQELSQQLQQMQSQMYEENLGEDVAALREILENLIQLSFDQEALIEKLSETTTQNPRYIEIMRQQNQIRDDIQMVEDSLFALSKRQPMVEPFVLKEVGKIENNLDKAIESLNERRTGEAAGEQQFVMTSVNNLALLLSEALEQMMQAMQMQGSGQCKKGNPMPGSGAKPASAKSMRQLQEQLNQQIQQLKDGKQKGQGQKQGDGQRQQSMSEQLARMAAQQAAIRRMMEGYQEELKKQGMGNSKEMQSLMDEMERTETELVNKIITQQTLERQKEILSRLLKHERAELEREREQKRESTEAKEENYSNPSEFLEYKRLKSQEVELLRTVPPNLRPYYKSKVNEYFYNFELK